MRVMIVDNDEAWVRSMTLLLTARGDEVYPFTDPAEACEFVRQIAEVGVIANQAMPEAVVLDYVMPEMSGVQVLGRIGAQLGAHCRVVFLTGHSELLRSANVSQMGVSACLEKPVDLGVLVDAIEGETA